MQNRFEREWATYQANKPDLLRNEGSFVVIRGEQVLGVYPTMAQALESGTKAYSPEPFFVHKIIEKEPEVYGAPPFVGVMSKASIVAYPAL